MGNGSRLRMMVAVLVAVLALAVSVGEARASDCGCSKVGDYKAPATKSPAIGSDGRSPGGKYVVSTVGTSPVTVMVKRTDNSTTVFSTTGNLAGWAFSPDEDRFVYHYMSGNLTKVHNVELYDLAAKRTVTSMSAITSSARYEFSPSGRYMMYSAITDTQRARITVVDSVSGVVGHETEFNFSTPPGSPGDSYGTVQWGFSPDAANRTFVYGYVNGPSSVFLTAVNLARREVVVSEPFAATGFWQFSPCGDVLGLVAQYGQSQMDVSLFNTSRRLPRIAGTQVSVGTVTLSTNLTSHVATVSGTPVTLTPNVADSACPTVAGVTLTPATVTGGSGVSVMVKLTGRAPFEGVPVTLTSANSAVAKVSGTGTVNVVEGLDQAKFSLTTSAVAVDTDVTITAKSGTVTKSATLRVVPPVLTRIELSPSSVTGGSSASGKAVLTGPAPAGGVIVDVSSANTAVATLGTASVTVAKDAKEGRFSIATTPVTADTPVSISGALRSTPQVVKSGVLTVTPPAVPVQPPLTNFHVSPTSVGAGAPSTGFVILGSQAPPDGVVVTLGSSDPSRASAPATVKVPAGLASATFPIGTTGGPDTQVTMSATLGATTRSAVLTIAAPPAINALTLSPGTVLGGGGGTTATVTLTKPAWTGGTDVGLSSANTGLATVASRVTVPAGATTVSFAVGTPSSVSSEQTVSIRAWAGGETRDARLTLIPPGVTGLSASPASVDISGMTTLRVSLAVPAPAGGMAVALSSSNPFVVDPGPSVTVPAGASSVSFAVYPGDVGATTISATANAGTASTAVTVYDPCFRNRFCYVE